MVRRDIVVVVAVDAFVVEVNQTRLIGRSKMG